ncbi:MAG: Mth938-like domain-containing protein [Betaproteobacteria bacterium]
MKFHLQTPASNVIAAVGADWIRIGETEYRQNLIVTPDAVETHWAPAGFAALTESDFAALLLHKPELVLLGTGTMQRFPHPRLLEALTQARVGVEVMDTRAACRTFNILIAEDRRAVAALIQG